MNDSEKREFLTVMTTTADLYDKTIKPERVAVYWAALSHRDMEDIKTAINRHIQDAERGRFFPLPADISAQLPSETYRWLTADEAWASVPKDENTSAAMCDEMAQALYIAQDLMQSGDMIAARRAFIDHYNRLVNDAKREGKNPKWWPSFGVDKTGRYKAECDVVKMNNLCLPDDKKKALPEPPELKTISLEDLANKAQSQNKDIAAKGMQDLRAALKK